MMVISCQLLLYPALCLPVSLSLPLWFCELQSSSQWEICSTFWVVYGYLSNDGKCEEAPALMILTFRDGTKQRQHNKVCKNIDLEGSGTHGCWDACTHTKHFCLLAKVELDRRNISHYWPQEDSSKLRRRKEAHIHYLTWPVFKEGNSTMAVAPPDKKPKFLTIKQQTTVDYSQHQKIHYIFTWT